jgi:hypothetical protein
MGAFVDRGQAVQDFWRRPAIARFQLCGRLRFGAVARRCKRLRQCKVFNLGSSEVVGLKALADTMVALGYGGAYELIPFPPERKAIDIGDYYSDFSLITKELGWVPKVGLSEGLLKTIAFYKEHPCPLLGCMIDCTLCADFEKRF